VFISDEEVAEDLKALEIAKLNATKSDGGMSFLTKLLIGVFGFALALFISNFVANLSVSNTPEVGPRKDPVIERPVVANPPGQNPIQFVPEPRNENESPDRTLPSPR